ncbi:hypothetical protein AHIS1_p047 [Acaryochloris phage A-HIS1]|nr:hypothetical protein AHIS1_p047 [Acaryochloris phage A-HIS1]
MDTSKVRVTMTGSRNGSWIVSLSEFRANHDSLTVSRLEKYGSATWERMYMNAFLKFKGELL